MRAGGWQGPSEAPGRGCGYDPGVFVTRFAPSPTGPLHLGHACAALTAWDAAGAAGGRFLLRIEDIDATRARPEWDRALREDLAWLGLRWEESVRRQSEHLGDYAAALDHLRARGLVYRCFRTRREVLEASASAPHGPHGAERGDAGVSPAFRGGPLPLDEEARRVEAGEPFAWRLSLDAARAALGPAWKALAFTEEGAGPDGAGRIPARPERLGDMVLARRDGGVAYHLAVVVDDALQGVTHVVRGDDLQEAAHGQRLLQALLALPEPTYRHHPVLLGPDGKRLAKRSGAESLAALRAAGVTPAQVRRRAGLPPAPPPP